MRHVRDDVVAAAQRGDPQALRAIYTALAPAVLGYATAHGASDPESTTSDVFLVVLPRLPQLHGGAAGLRTFTLSVAHARVVDELRSRNRRPANVPYDPAADQRTCESAEQVALQSDGTARALALLAQLPDDQRAVLSLRVVADLSVEQTARVLGKSSGAVKQLQRRGLLALRRAVASNPIEAAND